MLVPIMLVALSVSITFAVLFKPFKSGKYILKVVRDAYDMAQWLFLHEDKVLILYRQLTLRSLLLPSSRVLYFWKWLDILATPIAHDHRGLACLCADNEWPA